jgi:hypothetical protein
MSLNALAWRTTFYFSRQIAGLTHQMNLPSPTESNEIFTREFLRTHLSATEAGKAFGITNDYVTTLCRRKKVAGVFIGRIWYVEKVALGRYLETVRAESARKQSERSRELSKQYALFQKTAAAAFIIVCGTFAPHAHAYQEPVAARMAAVAEEIKNIFNTINRFIRRDTQRS